VAEISGFADLFFVLFGFVLGSFYTPFVLDSSILTNCVLADRGAKDGGRDPFGDQVAPFNLRSKQVKAIN